MTGSSRTWLKGSGVAFSTMLIAGGLIARSGGIQDPSQQIVAALENRSLAIMIAGYLLTISAALLVLFAQALSASLRQQVDAVLWPRVTAAGGILAAVLIMISAMAGAGAAERAAAQAGIGGESAAALVVLSTILMGKGFPIGAGVLIGAAGLSLPAAGGSRLFSWLSLGLAVGLLSPLNFYFVYFIPVWTALSGWLLPQEDKAAGALNIEVASPCG